MKESHRPPGAAVSMTAARVWGGSADSVRPTGNAFCSRLAFGLDIYLPDIMGCQGRKKYSMFC